MTTDVTEETAVGVADIAVMLKCSPATVRSLARAKTIPAFKVGRDWRFFPSKVKLTLDPPEKDLWAAPEHHTKKRRAA